MSFDYVLEFDGEVDIIPALDAALVVRFREFLQDERPACVDPGDGYTCPWDVDDEGTALSRGYDDATTGFFEWLVFIRDGFMTPAGRALRGTVRWRGDDFADFGTIFATEAGIEAVIGRFPEKPAGTVSRLYPAPVPTVPDGGFSAAELAARCDPGGGFAEIVAVSCENGWDEYPPSLAEKAVAALCRDAGVVFHGVRECCSVGGVPDFTGLDWSGDVLLLVVGFFAEKLDDADAPESAFHAALAAAKASGDYDDPGAVAARARLVPLERPLTRAEVAARVDSWGLFDVVVVKPNGQRARAEDVADFPGVTLHKTGVLSCVRAGIAVSAHDRGDGIAWYCRCRADERPGGAGCD